MPRQLNTGSIGILHPSLAIDSKIAEDEQNHPQWGTEKEDKKKETNNHEKTKQGPNDW